MRIKASLLEAFRLLRLLERFIDFLIYLFQVICSLLWQRVISDDSDGLGAIEKAG